MKLLIRNLARTTTEKDLRVLFEAFGAVQSCDLVLDKVSGGSKGFAFVEMPRPGEAKVAIKAMNGKEIDSNTLRVKYATISPKNKASASSSEKPKT
jgi:RNA recognition motif-containing protein